MTWVGTGIAVSAGINYIGGRNASKDADKRQDSANAVTQEQLDFNKDVYADQLDFQLLDRERFDKRYDKLESIFGPIEENLGNFYNSLTPETFTAAGLQEQNQQFQEAKTNFNTQLAQRKLTGSGVGVAALKDMELQNAKEKATIRRDAPFKVADAKQGFLATRGGAGAPPGPTDTSGVNASYGNQANALQQQANNASNTASSLYQSAGNLLMTGLQYGAQNNWGANQGGTMSSLDDYGAGVAAQTGFTAPIDASLGAGIQS